MSAVDKLGISSLLETRNDDEALYMSPLREDPRPMDGIYHATFVSARMYWLLSQLIDSELLDAEERTEALQSLDRDRRNFEAGHTLVSKHGRLTETGTRIMASACDFMNATNTLPTKRKEILHQASP